MPALAQFGPLPGTATPAAIDISFESTGSVSFRMQQQRVTRIDFRIRGFEYSVSLECAGGLRDVRFETARLFSDQRPGEPVGAPAFGLTFDLGSEDARRFGRLPRVQVSVVDGRVTELLLTNMTGENASLTEHLCRGLSPDPTCAPDLPRPRLMAADVLLTQLRDLPPRLQAGGNPTEVELRRRGIYEELMMLGTDAIPALARGLRDPSVDFRRNVALVLGVLSGGWWQFACGEVKVDISGALPAMIASLGDPDPTVRGWSAQAIGNIGGAAAGAVPALLDLLMSADEASRISACIALRGIGPAARDAMPALREALTDPSRDVRRFAIAAIEAIERPGQ